jgi:phosphate transport system substrate-binding protein
MHRFVQHFALILSMVLASSLPACSEPNLDATELVIGADAHSLSLVEGLINGYETAYPDTVITLQNKGRDLILADVSSEALDAGIVWSPPTGETVFSTVIAADILVFIVNPSNPVESISNGDLRSIFRGHIVDWKQVAGEASSIEVTTYPNGSSPRLVMESVLLLAGKVSPASHLAADPDSMLLFVASTPGSIGYIPFSSLSVSSKSIVIDGIPPTRENAQNRSYPYVAQIAFVSGTEPDGHLRHFLEWILSAQGQQVVRRYSLGYND